MPRVPPRRVINDVLHRRRTRLRWLVALCVIAITVNLAWEMAQSYFYEPMGDWWQSTRRCLIASVGDGVMVLLVVSITCRPWREAGGALVAHNAREYMGAMALGLAMAVVVEEWGLTQGWWVYRPEMPTVPGTPFGVVPLAQMGVLTPLTVWMADRFTGRAG